MALAIGTAQTSWRDRYPSNFCFCVKVVLEREGVLSNDPRDAGGLTRFGIAQKFHPDVDVANLTEDKAVDIYHDEYYVAVGIDQLPMPWQLLVFDGVVNQPLRIPGPEDGIIEMLQDTLGVPDDGQLGPLTASRAVRFNDEEHWEDFLSRRALRYARHSEPAFQRGLFKRLFAVYHAGLYRMIPGKGI